MRLIIINLFAIATCLGLNAQTLKGKVVDTKNQPIEDAYVFNMTSGNHTHSSGDGVFFIGSTKVGDSISIGLLGYETLKFKVDNNQISNQTIFILNEKIFSLDELVISESINPVNTIVRLDIATNPVNSSQDILRKVPGLFIGQHAGGGKAEQIFLRGFDIDHGTDVAISVDGMPVNMVSHAHGQGYSDLHFLIPETINTIDFGKGPYYAGVGDFNTAGYVGFSTLNRLKESSITVSAGQFNTIRTLGMFNLIEDQSNQSAYAAIEYLAGDGPFESPQGFNRLNIFGKYTSIFKNNDKLSVTASHFTSRWDASGQIPQRAVDDGSITRFGAIDDTEGGNTSRTNVNIALNKRIDDETTLKSNMYYSKYDFELYSNFTFFLEDPINGDQIRQRENRDIIGLNSSITKNTNLGNVPVEVSSGFGFRHDMVRDVELSRSLNRSTTLENIQLGDLDQTNIDGFVKAKFDFGKFSIAPGLRLDYFKFMYNDKLQPTYTVQSENKTIVSPKLNFYYDLNRNMQLFLKSGIGFHSNDTRVVVNNLGEDILPRAYGVDLGTVWKPASNLVVNTALWYLYLEQEFVYVGDAGIVEPSGRTERFGLDLGLRYQINDWLYFDSDATYTDAKSLDDPDGENFIPLAPKFTATGGFSVSNLDNFSGGLRMRYLGDRPANEDNSIVAEGYFVTDLNLNYNLSKNITLGLIIENLFDVDWNETQFATESRLASEVDSVEEIHFTPGTPFFLRGSITYRF
ncbi:TonB-dependent receptor [Paucihalobacter sp.]|uniref:TonB-dependent receptor n=1 Tax=Paucihalobacter sp. TaxID=2850405 RepID=UPI002FE2DDA0